MTDNTTRESTITTYSKKGAYGGGGELLLPIQCGEPPHWQPPGGAPPFTELPPDGFSAGALCFELKSRHIAVLRYLQHVRDRDLADGRLSSSTFGFVGVDDIAKALANGPEGFMPSGPAVRAYVCAIRRRIREAAAAASVDPPLFLESRRGRGVRLVVPIHFVPPRDPPSEMAA